MKNRKPLIIGAAVGLAAAAIAAIILGIKCSGRNVDTEPEVIDTPTSVPVVSVAPITDEPAVTPEPTLTPEPTPTPEPFTVTMRTTDGFVKACSTGTYGVATDGSIRFMGRSVSGQHFITGWSSVIDVELNDSTTAALKRDGTVLMTGSQKTEFAEALDWTGVVDLSMGKNHLAGLKTDGSVIVCGSDAGALETVSSWYSVKKIVSGDDFAAGLSLGRVVTTASGAPEAFIQGEVADIAAAGERLALLMSDGHVKLIENVASAPEFRDYDWEKIVKVYVSPNAVYAIDNTGKLFTDSTFVDKEVNDAYCVAASSKHAVVLRGNGRCVSFGENKDMQGNVGNWCLLPFLTDEGWLIGYGPGTYMGSDTLKTGRELTYSNPATGESSPATIVILGDVNGDAQIDEKDVAAVKAHINGTKKLEGPFLRAANVIDDSAKPGVVDSIDLDRLTEAVEGKRPLDRYAKTDKYTAPLATAQRKNKDTLGYIKIRNTNIDYPIMYGANWFYNDHEPDKSSSVRGSIYFYRPYAGGNIVITGHNSRTSGTMFHQLHKVQDNASTLKSYSDRLWAINTYGQTGYWEVWAMYEEGAFKNADDSSQMFNTCWPHGYGNKTDEEKQAWIDYQQRKNQLGYTVNVTINDRFMTLVTCGDSHADAQKGARLYFFLRWVGND